jgi:hypothetical protein
MAKSIVAGFTLAALILMGLLAYAQKHLECRDGYLIKHGHIIKHGHFIKSLRSFCGSVSPSM